MLTVRHIELKDANTYVTAHHRHHKAVRGHRFSLACYEGDRLCGVAIVGRPRTDKAPVCPKHLYEIILTRKEELPCKMY